MSTGERTITVCFVGNPNCGKTTLFNAFTGAKLKVANWPGVTVERMEGETSYKGRKIRVIDTPESTVLLHIQWRNSSQEGALKKMAWT